MAASPALAEQLARSVAEVYAKAELRLIRLIAQRLASGAESPYWAEQKLAEVTAVRRQIEAVISSLNVQAIEAARAAIEKAYNRGDTAAMVDLREVLGTTVFPPIPNRGGLQALVTEAVTNLRATNNRILRQSLDTYRTAIVEASAQVLIGAETRLRASQHALDRFATAGISGFTDRAGRRWDLTTYAEMAVRTASGRAAVQGHVDRLVDNGRDMAIISSHAGACPKCGPWQGRIVSLTGRTPGLPTLAQAHASGFQHVNCRHSVGLYVPGLTNPPNVQSEENRARDYGYSQQQRYNERAIRRWKRRAAGALTPEALARAQDKVRQWQQINARFTGEHGLRRKYEREGLGVR